MPVPALVLVDLQYEFFWPGEGRVGNAIKALCLPGAERLVDLARSRGWKVIHVLTSHEQDATMPGHLRRMGLTTYCRVGSEAVDLYGPLVKAEDIRVEKTSYSGFHTSLLAEHLEGNDPVIIAGVATDCCVLHTAFDAATRADKEVFLPFQAVSASSFEGYSSGLKTISKSAGSIIDLETLERDGRLDWNNRLDGMALEAAWTWFKEMQSRYRAVEPQYLELVQSQGIRRALADLVGQLR